jgi:hypothetical protein
VTQIDHPENFTPPVVDTHYPSRHVKNGYNLTVGNRQHLSQLFNRQQGSCIWQKMKPQKLFAGA